MAGVLVGGTYLRQASHPHLVDDGQGGVFLTWNENRSPMVNIGSTASAGCRGQFAAGRKTV